MSGPKDYGITYTLDRLDQFRRRNEAVQDARRVQVQAALMRSRQTAARQREAEAEKRREAVREGLVRKSEEARREMTASLAAAEQERQAAELSEIQQREADQQAVRELALAARDEKAAAVAGWADALSADTAVNTFAAAELAAWKRQAEGIASAADLSTKADTLVAAAEALHVSAGDTQAKFDTRNALLADVIASMQELGYFVSDPEYADAADPAGAVVLKATCGSETVTTTVDLGRMIKSVWDGQEHEHCKSSFFDYMDKMQEKGVSVEPERADLRDRPVLKQRGANELPRQTDAGKGA